MAGKFIAWRLLHLKYRIGQLQRHKQRLNWRELHDPFDLHETEFIKLYRVISEIVMEVTDALSKLRARLDHGRLCGLTPELQVLTALRFYAVGYYQGSIGEQWNIATSADHYRAREKFGVVPQLFIGAIWAINCTYVKMKAPTIHEEAYVNHYGDHTLNVQVICDPDLNILNVNVYPGVRHDAYIESKSLVCCIMQ